MNFWKADCTNQSSQFSNPPSTISDESSTGTKLGLPRAENGKEHSSVLNSILRSPPSKSWLFNRINVAHIFSYICTWHWFHLSDSPMGNRENDDGESGQWRKKTRDSMPFIINPVPIELCSSASKQATFNDWHSLFLNPSWSQARFGIWFIPAFLNTFKISAFGLKSDESKELGDLGIFQAEDRAPKSELTIMHHGWSTEESNEGISTLLDGALCIPSRFSNILNPPLLTVWHWEILLLFTLLPFTFEALSRINGFHRFKSATQYFLLALSANPNTKHYYSTTYRTLIARVSSERAIQ